MTSEQALITLEKSKESPTSLLDIAADIASIEFNEEQHVYEDQQSSTSTASDFRLQWLLKWLLKRLNESANAIDGNKNSTVDESLLTNPKALALLSYLIESINNKALHEILFERDVTTLLSTAGRLIHQNFASSKLVETGSQASDIAQDRRKRRRLSPSDDTQSPSAATTRQVSHIIFLNVVREYACAIRGQSVGTNQTGKPKPRFVPRPWARSSKDVADLLAVIVQVVIDLYRQDAASSQVHIFPTINYWFEQWHSFITFENAVNKQKIDTQFSEACLNKCLSLLEYIRSVPSDQPGNLLKHEIERSIALHIILPLRSYFNANYAETWKSLGHRTSWSTIEPLYEKLVSHLGAALRKDSVLGVEYVSFECPQNASVLFQIASDLIPRDDLRQRRRENSWLNALCLVIMHLAFPQNMYRLHFSHDDKILDPENLDLPYDSQYITQWPKYYLQTILDQRLDLTPSAAAYLCIGVLKWRATPLPVSTLANLLRLSPESFVPQNNDPNSRHCLSLLLECMEGMDTLSYPDITLLTQEVVQPLMTTFARLRDIDGFVDIWLPRIENAFRSRFFDSASFDSRNSASIFDDEDLFFHFEETVKLYAPQMYGSEFVSVLSQDLSTIAKRIGSTADIFAKVAVVNSILRSRGSALMSQNPKLDIFALTNSALQALELQSDYQGQRWRLLALMKTACSLDFSIAENLQVHELWAKTSDLERDELSFDITQLQPSNRLMGFHYAFALVAECGSAEVVKLTAEYMHDVLSHLKQTRDGNNSQYDLWLECSWSGRLSTLQTIGQLLAAHVSVLLQLPQSRLYLFQQHISETLQTIVFKFPDRVLDGSVTSSLANLLQLLLSRFARTNNKISSAKLPEFALTDPSTTFLHVYELNLDQIRKPQAAQYAEILVQQLSTVTKPSKSKVDLASSLSFLLRLVQRFPVSVGTPQDFAKLARISSAVHAEDEENSNAIIHIISELACVTCSRLRDISEHKVLVEMYNNIIKPCRSLMKHLDKDRVSETNIALLNAVLGFLSENKHTDIEEAKVTRLKKEYVGEIKAIMDNSNYARLLKCLFAENGWLALIVRDSNSTGQDVEEEFRNKVKQTFRQLSDPKSSHSLQPQMGDHGSIPGDVTIKSMDGLLQEALSICRSTPRDQTKGLFDTFHETGHKASCRHSILISTLILSLGSDQDWAISNIVDNLMPYASLQHITSANNTSELVLQLGLSKIILLHQPEVIGQATMDSLLEMLIQLTSSAFRPSHFCDRAASIGNNGDSEAIYGQILNVLGAILSRHRRRLTGRTHMLLILLQNLLKCLFYVPTKTHIYQNPATVKQKRAFYSSLPPWLQLGSGQPLPASAAEKFSRVLSSICNPTTASARSAHRGRRRKADIALALNDETAKAKRIASQYMQYLLVEYTRCILDGVISPLVREKLYPGLYSVLDCLDRDLRSTINSAMDPSSRAIFKDLYNDWTKYGKWDQT